MRDYLAGAWWLLLFQGILLVLFGLFAVVWPGLTLAGFAVGFAIYLVANGIVTAIASFGAIGRVNTWFLWLLMAAVEIGIGIYAFKHLGLTIGTLIVLLGLFLVVRGVQQLISAFGDGHESRHRTLFAIGGILSLIAGIVVWVYPVSSGIAFAWIIGVYGIVAGTMVTALAIEVRALPEEALRPARP